jgi:hypothetical protein
VRADDELEPRQPDAVVGKERQREGLGRVGDVHHHARAGARQVGEIGPLDADRQVPAIHETGFAFRARHGDGLTGGDRRRAGRGADDRGDAQFPAHDGRVARAPAAVRDDGRSPPHHGLPVRVGHLRDQDFALPELLEIRGRADDARGALADLLADAAARRQHVALRVEEEPLQDERIAPRLHGLGPRLHEEELPAAAVLGPLDVHRRVRPAQGRVVRLHEHRPPRQRQDVVVGEHEPLAVRPGDRHAARLAGPALLVDQLELLRAEPLLEDGAEALRQGRLEHVVFVRVHRALHDAFAEPVSGVDQHGIREAGLRVDREHDAGRREVRPDHFLDADRQRDLRVIEAAIRAVDDRAVREERRVAPPYGVDEHRGAVDVEVRLLLAGEAGLGQILGGRAAAHGDVAVCAVRVLQTSVSEGDLRGQFRRQLGCQDGRSHAGAGRLEPIDVGDVELPERGGDDRREPGPLHEVPVGGGRGGEAVGRPDAEGRQRAPHLAKRRVLAADGGNVAHADRVEPANQRSHATPLADTPESSK